MYVVSVVLAVFSLSFSGLRKVFLYSYSHPVHTFICGHDRIFSDKSNERHPLFQWERLVQ